MSAQNTLLSETDQQHISVVMTTISEAAAFIALDPVDQTRVMAQRILELEEETKRLKVRAQVADIFNPPPPTALEKEVLDMVATKTPPVLFRGVRQDGSPVEWIRKHYARWIGNGLNQKRLKAIDKTLYTAFHNFCRDHKISPGGVLPPGHATTKPLIEKLQKSAPNADSRTLERMGAAARMLCKRSR